MSVILALDTATEHCSAALSVNGNILLRETEGAHKHAEQLLQQVQSLLDEGGVTLKDLNLIAFDAGPGSFTGVRIGVSATQGMALGLDIKAAGVTSLEIMASKAAALSQAEYVVSAIDARMGEVYWQTFARVKAPEQGVAFMQPMSSPFVMSPEAAVMMLNMSLDDGTFAGCGTGIELLRKAGLKCAEPAVLFPTADVLTVLGDRLAAAGKTVDAADAQPVYVRNDVAWKKTSEQHKAVK